MDFWTKKTGKCFALASIILLVGACKISYQFNASSIDYTKVRTITLETFPIKSTYVYAPLATEFNDKLQNIFVTQTRLQQVSSNGDWNISGEITGYEQLNQAVKADGFSSETQLKVTVNVRFVNNTNHAEDFEQPFSAFRNYPSSEQLVSVQDDLIKEIVKEITEQIFNATAANW